MKKDDLIYKDKEYQIYKKHAGAIGHFEPVSMLELMHIAIDGLAQWENGGFFSKKDYTRVVNDICKKLKGTIS